MNAEPTLRLIRRNFAEVKEMRPAVFRAERQHENRTLGVFYFDFSDMLLQADFDLKRYVQDNLASDFYRHEGSLQWNYYLYFVLERKDWDGVSGSGRAAKIEADRTYARKFVRERESFESELAQNLPDLLGTTRPLQDLASVWTEKLSAAGLGSVADPDKGYMPSVREYLEGRTVATPTAPATETAVAPGRFFEHIALEHFRAHPVQREFSLGTVNLIRGVNGTGKTSLLEAVELAVCGGIRRQDGKCPKQAKLTLRYAGQAVPEFAPATAALYRARDRTWYGGYRRQGTDLCHSFARFNFYDSDAAFRLSSATDSDEILRALDSLLLGERASTIETRMEQFLARFEQSESGLGRQRRTLETERDKAAEQLDLLTKIKDTRDVLARELRAAAQAGGWRKFPAEFNLKELAALLESVADSATFLNQAVKRLPWLGRVSVDSMAKAARQIETVLAHITKYKKDVWTLRAENAQAEKRIAEASLKVQLLLRLSAYHAEPQAIALLHASMEVETVKRTLACYKEASGKLRSVDLGTYAENKATLAELTAQNRGELGKLRRALSKLQLQQQQLSEQLGEINSVVEGIKGLGQRFCELKPHVNQCPLCGTDHQDLAGRIRHARFESLGETAVRRLAIEINRGTAEVAALAKTATTLQNLTDVATLLLPAEQVERMSLKSIVAALAQMSEAQPTAKARLDALMATQKRLRLAGFSEQELTELLETAEADFKLTETRVMKGESVRKLLEDAQQSLQQMQASLRDEQKKEKELEAEMKRRVRMIEESVDLEKAEAEFERRQAVLADVRSSLSNNRRLVALTDTDELSTAGARLVAFGLAISRAQDALKRVEEKDSLEERTRVIHQRASQELAALVPQHNRAKAGIEQLRMLLGADYKAAFKRQVVTEHREKLSAVFSRIHAPNEFRDVQFEPDLVLERYTGSHSGISEISTGQRSALALSIFLSLNSSVSERAPWLLFDDPVAHVDDLNSLSFFDLLRDLVLLGHRQVFFATASTRVADLFAKKFDYLGDGFKSIHLAR